VDLRLSLRAYCSSLQMGDGGPPPVKKLWEVPAPGSQYVIPKEKKKITSRKGGRRVRQLWTLQNVLSTYPHWRAKGGNFKALKFRVN